MKFETPMYSDGIVKSKQTVFGGLNHNPGAGDGQIYEMRNMCSDYYPLLATRPKRKKRGAYYAVALYGGSELFKVTSQTGKTTTNIEYGEKYLASALNNEKPKHITEINKSIVVLPDKKIYDTENNTISTMDAKLVTDGGDGTELCPNSTSEEIQVLSGMNVTFEFKKETKEITVKFKTTPGTVQTGMRAKIERTTNKQWHKARIAITHAGDVYSTGGQSSIGGQQGGELDWEYKYTTIEGKLINREEGPEYFEATPISVTIRIETAAEATFGTDSISWEDASFADFSVGDQVMISGCSIEENNGNYKVSAISGNTMQFSDANFTAGSVTETTLILENRTLPPLKFQDGTLYGESAVQNTIHWDGANFTEYFKAGDAIEISNSSIEENNNKTVIVREVTDEELRFYEYSFTNGTDTSRATFIKRNVPDLKFVFESGNRVWGSDGKTIYASKLGDPTNWYVYDGLETDSWTLDAGGLGDVIAGTEFQGYPTFMKDGDLYKVFGSMPSNFEMIRVANIGCAPGSEKSLAVAGETLFYHNYNGIYAYAGGVPALVSQAFGVNRYRNAIAGSDGVKYYVNMQDDQGAWHIFVYDTRTGLWHEEDDKQVIDFAYCKGHLHFIETFSESIVGNTSFAPVEYGNEPSFNWYVEFTDFTDDSPNKKDFKRLQIRLELDEDTSPVPSPPWVKAKLMMDSDGKWIEPEGGTIEDPEKRSYLMTIIPRRADHYRLRLEGHGGCRIYSIAREFSEGSDLKSVKGRQ